MANRKTQNYNYLKLRLDSEKLNKIYEVFEKKTKHFNFIFSSGNDFIYEFFKFDNKYKNNYLNQLVKFLGKNKLFNNIVSRYADQGLSI